MSLGLLVAPAGQALAAPITFTYTFRQDGTFNGVAFTDALIQITASGDADNRERVRNAYRIRHDSASVFIGLDDPITAAFTVRSYTFVNHFSDLVGFSADVSAVADRVYVGTDAAFERWDMRSAIGPITLSGHSIQWGSLATTGGILNLVNQPHEVTFSAETPQPQPILNPRRWSRWGSA
jgi:hypothetical protein